jgi:enterochelin esterase family protein
MEGQAPLIEPIPGDQARRLVTFLWRERPETSGASVSGGLPSVEEQKPLTRLAGTDVWYRTERLPADARFTYNFVITKQLPLPGSDGKGSRDATVECYVPDPLNPRIFTDSSVAELPDAPEQPWTARLPGVPAGKLEEHTVNSSSLKEERTVHIYTPPGGTRDGSLRGLLVLFDGESMRSQIPVPVILDNLISKGKVPPLVAVMVHNKDRNKDLGCSEAFANFTAKELVLWTRSRYGIKVDPHSTIVAGLSLGGVMASFTALRHPEVFGNVLSLSGGFVYYPELFADDPFAPPPVEREPGWLTRQFVREPRRPIRFYLEVGRFERGFGLDQLGENRRFRDVLEAKGYEVTYQEFSGGHDYLRWRGTFADGLIKLIGASR